MFHAAMAVRTGQILIDPRVSIFYDDVSPSGGFTRKQEVKHV